MKTKIIKFIPVFALTAALAATPAFAGEKEDGAALVAKAKVTKVEAEATALKKAPGGKVKDAEIEMEKGVLIWSIDISKPGTTDITEVNVNATTGKVVNVEIEKAGKDGEEKD